MEMSQQETDEKYMRRCLQIARCGLRRAKPNPSVGAVIVADGGRIIGEGFTSAYGGPHAEVNAFASVRQADEALLPEATVYVSLEPCSHYGHTPPCCDLIISKGVRRVVCGCVDPFAKVRGRGIRKLRDAGIEVTVGVLERECIASNKRFMTFNTLGRPWITLKWAQTANGFMGGPGGTTLHVSTPFTLALSHRLRAESDAILVGRRTLLADHPQLTTRLWAGPDPERIVLSHHGDGIPAGFVWMAGIDAVMRHLREEKKQSLIVEGGAATLQGFIDRGLWDELRVETGSMAASDGVRAPLMPPEACLVSRDDYDGNVIEWFRKQ